MTASDSLPSSDIMEASWAAHTGISLHAVTCQGLWPKPEDLLSNINLTEPRCLSSKDPQVNRGWKLFPLSQALCYRYAGVLPISWSETLGSLLWLQKTALSEPILSSLERLLKGGFWELVFSHHLRAYLCGIAVSLPLSNKPINTSIIDRSGNVLKFNPTPWPFLLKKLPEGILHFLCFFLPKPSCKKIK